MARVASRSAGRRIAFAFASLLAGCSKLPVPSGAEGCSLLGESCRDIPADEARRFTMERCGEITRLAVNQPWRGARDISRYLLVPRNRPDLLERAGRLARNPDVTVVAVPVRRVASLSTVYAGFLDQLGKQDLIVGIGNPKMVWTPSVASRVARGEVADLGSRGMAVSQNLESMLQLRPDLVLASGSGIPAYDRNEMFREFGLPVVVVAEWMEDTPKGRAEWLRFLGAFVGEERRADSLYRDIARRYDSVRASLADAVHRPEVVVGSNWSGAWHVPAGGSYVAMFLRDAGAHYPWNDLPGAGSVPMGVEAVVLRGHDAEVWLHPGQAKSLKAVTAMDPRNVVFRPLGTGRVFNFNRRVNEAGGNDYWESGVVRPDRVLADLGAILQPRRGDTDMTYYRRLDGNP